MIPCLGTCGCQCYGMTSWGSGPEGTWIGWAESERWWWSPCFCYKVIQDFMVTGLFAGQHNTKLHGTITGVILFYQFILHYKFTSDQAWLKPNQNHPIYAIKTCSRGFQKGAVSC